jgi:hypothetical protein
VAPQDRTTQTWINLDGHDPIRQRPHAVGESRGLERDVDIHPSIDPHCTDPNPDGADRDRVDLSGSIVTGHDDPTGAITGSERRIERLRRPHEAALIAARVGFVPS